ncbi:MULTISPECIES: penicillin-binding protein 2 [unclassified Virgibacillus]|uniref:peptidoglycan D,D-transpeptidase FtsI family protein n=1 Tax=unclassified Virgibacillus TaxID=2620237 RepID=UPI0024DE1107|nr:penicillin-binding protein 2 [Virgibacillus sp. LDC-1]
MNKKKKKKKAQLPFRLNILFFVVFILFSVLILQLGVVQILNGESFQEEIDRTIQDTTSVPVPRGKIYDRNHNVVVDNEALYAITYTPPKGVQADDRLEVAERLAKYISMFDKDPKEKKKQIARITDRDKKEYWYLLHSDEAEKRLSQKEAADMEPGEQYQTILDRITEEEISHYDEQDLEIILIKKELDKAYSLTPQIVKNNGVTPEEYARVAEHLNEMPGINATTDWNRAYPYKDTVRSIIGNITDEKRGIPRESMEYYLAKGYSRNDRVGISGLEEQYEDVLRGRKEKIEYTTNKNGQVVDMETVVKGERGKDLVLTIDMEFQERLDKIVREELKKTINKLPSLNRYLEDAIAVVMNPKTGELLGVSAQHYNRKTNKYENADYKALYDAHRPGSSVKGATVLAGYEEGVISPGTRLYDSPIKIKGTPTMKSYKNMGWVDDLYALEKSSNVYMFHIALRMAGEYSTPNNTPVNFKGDPFLKMRNYFSQFGLGVKTGVDFPYESSGFKGNAPLAGNLLHYSIGQYDTYTALQLAQYVSTIANGGYRVKPHFVKEIREPSPSEKDVGPVFRTIHPEVLNRIQMKDAYIERVQKGFRRVFTTGTASVFANEPYKAAGKTGTAENEVYKDGKKLADTENHILVGYAPYDDPEVAFAVIIPNTGLSSSQHPSNKTIGKGILDTYFELKEERAKENVTDAKEETESEE